LTANSSLDLQGQGFKTATLHQLNDSQHNDIQHKDTQHNETKDNDALSSKKCNTQHGALSVTIKKCDTQHNIMLSVVYAHCLIMPIMLSSSMLNVVMLLTLL
jgi:hypothetical protein